jgi:hypothetical protein
VRETFGRHFEENDEEMAVKLRRQIRPGRRNSKPRWRRLLLQSENALKVTLVGLDINNIGYLLHM